MQTFHFSPLCSIHRPVLIIKNYLYVITTLILVLGSTECLWAQPYNVTQLMQGDIVFIRSTSRQSTALEQGTGSIWTHVGILFKERQQWVVYEATQPVKATPLSEFVGPARSRDSQFVIKRVSSDIIQLNESSIRRLKQECAKDFGKSYDIFFNWDDSKLYCSEYVFKCFQRTFKVELSEFETLGDMNQDSPVIQSMIDQRWARNAKTDDERLQILSQVYTHKVITPVQLYESPLLECVQSHEGPTCPKGK